MYVYDMYYTCLSMIFIFIRNTANICTMRNINVNIWNSAEHYYEESVIDTLIFVINSIIWYFFGIKSVNILQIQWRDMHTSLYTSIFVLPTQYQYQKLIQYTTWRCIRCTKILLIILFVTFFYIYREALYVYLHLISHIELPDYLLIDYRRMRFR